MKQEPNDIFARPSAEFAPGASVWPEDASRRDFIKLMTASLALAGIAGCSNRPDEKIIPYAVQPEGITPGDPILYASAMPHDGYLRGVTVTTREGRPIKVDGNPDHPASLGGSDIFLQASVLSLYDPDRSRNVTQAGRPVSWSAFLSALQPRINKLRDHRGKGLRFLTTPSTSPTLFDQMGQVKDRFPKARWIEYSPTQRLNTREASSQAFGRVVDTVYDFSKAQVILSLDSNFLIEEPGSLRYARQFADARRVRKGRSDMSRLYVIESTLSITGSNADHRVAVRPSEVARVASDVLGGIREDKSSHDWLQPIIDDLKQHRGQSIVIAGECQPPQVHALVHAINAELGNAGNTVRQIETVSAPALTGMQALHALVDDLRSGEVTDLFILGGNPIATAPADIALHEAIRAASNSDSAFTCHLGYYSDLTADVCQWHIPEAHYLESWSDGRAFDGTASIIQPAIDPLFGGKTTLQVIAALLGALDQSDHDRVRGYWMRGKSEDFWNEALRKGIIGDSAAKPVDVKPRDVTLPPIAQSDIELTIRPDPNLWDGSYFNNPWLQELPRPFTKLVWDNAALISPGLASTLAVDTGQVVQLESSGRLIEIPVMVLPGLPDNAVTVYLCYDQIHGVDTYPLRASNAMWTGPAKVTPTKERFKLVTTQNHNALDHGEEAKRREQIHLAPLADFEDDPHKIVEPPDKKILLSLYQPWDYSKGHQWAMSIDTGTCIGCNACVIACQAENNIPVVGKDQVDRMREMHWLRIDNYFTGDKEHPSIVHLPVPCMHCENAPCEYVCPVGATTHSVEGLNQMTYNRCVGTRYCSNNCPYKVRRFNFLAYANSETTPERAMQRNPEVTVRTNGVMEKCTYCIQRIQNTRIALEREQVQQEEAARRAGDDAERTSIRDKGATRQQQLLESLQTACQQSCPTNAIIFGDLHAPGSQVAREKAEPHDYSLLEELNTKPRTTYLARISNPNPAWTGGPRA